MSHKCGCRNRRRCDSDSILGEGFCGIDPCLIIILILILAFLCCGHNRC